MLLLLQIGVCVNEVVIYPQLYAHTIKTASIYKQTIWVSWWHLLEYTSAHLECWADDVIMSKVIHAVLHMKTNSSQNIFNAQSFAFGLSYPLALSICALKLDLVAL